MLSTYVTQYDTLNIKYLCTEGAECFHAECRYACIVILRVLECLYAYCRYASIVILRVFGVIMQTVIMLVALY
jgi:hypothetical protein